MKWRLGFSKRADEQLSKLSPGISRVIVTWLLKNIDGCEDPRRFGKPLKGEKNEIWRYRIGDYRALCEIRDDELLVLAIEIGHRRDIYKR